MFKPAGTVPIGIFDSGVGGLSVWKEAIKILPGHNFIYFADSAYSPYGPRSEEEIVERSAKITEFFISQGVGMVIIACNTATSAAIAPLRERFAIPFIGMEPAVKPAAALTKSGVIGVLATKGTLSGRLYNRTLNLFASDVKVVEVVGTGLVPLVESGKTSGKEVENLLEKYISPMVDMGADYIVLGCTHYPFLRDAIQKIAGESVTLLDPAPAVARHMYKVAKENKLIDPIGRDNILGVNLYKSCYMDTQFFSSGSTAILERMARKVIPEIPDSCFKSIRLT